MALIRANSGAIDSTNYTFTFLTNTSQYNGVTKVKNGEVEAIVGTGANITTITVGDVTCTATTSGADLTFNITGKTGKIYGGDSNGGFELKTTITDPTTGGSAVINVMNNPSTVVFIED